MKGAPTYRILHRDAALLVVDKAPGVLTVGRPGSRERCLLDDLRRDGHKVAPVHRLDRDTSGVLLLSLDPAHRPALEAAFRQREVRKEYLALVEGVPAARRASIDLPIADEGKSARVDRAGRPAVTRYEVLETFAGRASLVLASPVTGRHNQIRVHFAHIGHPLLGDRKYGRRRAGPGRVLLHAGRLALRHPVTGAELDVRAPPPEDFARACEALRSGAWPD
ncbi:MAG TPA: RluA family pseudouridine synthase [Planctomycetota bacterium]|nr:RluA family pseudouridine synthase [Planctomycetota bacterium]